MEKILDKANEFKYTTIAIPAFGTGKLRYPPELVAAEMFSCVQKHRESQWDTSLEMVIFVVYPKDDVVEQVSILSNQISGTHRLSVSVQPFCSPPARRPV